MRLLGLAGVAGPVVFFCAVTVAAALQPDYSHVSSFISELGASGLPRASVLNYGGFFGAGLLFALFGAGLAVTPPRRPLVLLGGALVTAFGVGVIASGALSCDPGCPQSGGSFANQLHNRIGPVAFISLIIATGIFGLVFRQVPQWRRFATYSLLTTACSMVFMAALVGSLDTRALTGLWQRLLLTTLFLWCMVVGTATYRGHVLSAAPDAG
jgi:hypothetical membrane protein